MNSAVDQVLEKGGVYLDDLTKHFRLIHPDSHQVAADLIVESEEYFQESERLQESIERFIQLLKKWRKYTDKERNDVVGKRSRLQSEKNEKFAAFHRLVGVIREKEAQLEHANFKHECLLRIEQENEEIILSLTKR